MSKGSKGQQVRDLEERVASLEESVKTLAKVFNENMSVTKDGFTLNDAHIRVLRLVCDDIAKGEACMWPPPTYLVTHLRSMLSDGASEEDVVKEWLDSHWGASGAKGVRVDLEWYYAKCNALESADMGHYLAEAEKGHEHGTGKES